MQQKLAKHTRSSYMERKNKSSQFVASHIDTKFWKGSFPRIISEHLLTKSALVVVHYLSMRNPKKVDFSSLGVKRRQSQVTNLKCFRKVGRTFENPGKFSNSSCQRREDLATFSQNPIL